MRTSPLGPGSLAAPRAGEMALVVPILIAILAVYGPTVWMLSNTAWQLDEQGHGPLVLAISGWLVWQKRHEFAALPVRPAGALAWALMALGLAVYVLGRSQGIPILDVGSVIPVLAGAIAAVWGWAHVRLVAFPLLYLFFMFPLPESFIDGMTVQLKAMVSHLAEVLLYAAGYPIARSGVTLSVGPYQLLVADACSGLRSMFSLGAMGLLYLYLVKHTSWWRNGLLLASILPIAFAANVVRVLILILVTYHYGDRAGQGFVHDFAGMVLFIVALLLLIAFDGLLGLFGRVRGASTGKGNA